MLWFLTSLMRIILMFVLPIFNSVRAEVFLLYVAVAVGSEGNIMSEVDVFRQGGQDR